MLLSGFTATAASDQWTLEFTQTFIDNYNSKDSENQHRVDEALSVLAGSKWPNKLGQIKELPAAFGGRVCVYDISRSSRLSYNVFFETKTIQCVRVCDHKTVQGKD
jgi:hypothetical protein